MELIGGVLVVAAVAVGAWRARRTMHGRSERRLAAADTFRVARRATDEDVTRLGEELVLLHEETLATPLDPAMREDYQRALDAYEGAKSRLADAATSADITAITRTLKDGRFAQACVLARRDGRPPAGATRPVLLRPRPRPGDPGRRVGTARRCRARDPRLLPRRAAPRGG